MPINLSIIIPWMNSSKQRYDNFVTLLLAINNQKFSDYEVIIVEQNTHTEGLEEYTHIKLESEIFNKSWCVNVGCKKAISENLVIIDADSNFDIDFFQKINVEMRKQKAFICWDTLRAETGKDNPKLRILSPNDIRTMGGVWAINKTFLFDKLGGMNESFFGYGGEDNEMYERICKTLDISHVSYISYTLSHSYHDWEKGIEKNSKLFEIGRKHPLIINERLKINGVGNDTPTPINVEDLK